LDTESLRVVHVVDNHDMAILSEGRILRDDQGSMRLVVVRGLARDTEVVQLNIVDHKGVVMFVGIPRESVPIVELTHDSYVDLSLTPYNSDETPSTQQKDTAAVTLVPTNSTNVRKTSISIVQIETSVTVVLLRDPLNSRLERGVVVPVVTAN
jgi:hypothetical protein